MKPWEIWDWRSSAAGESPVVVLGTDERVDLKPIVNVLLCSAEAVKRKAEIYEVILDEADGLDRDTLCRCDLVYAVRKDELVKHRGIASVPRQREIAERLIRSLGLAGL